MTSWTQKELRELVQVQTETRDDSAGSVAAVASRAVELVAARGGTMTAERLRGVLSNADAFLDAKEAAEVRQHIVALGDEIATLRAKVAELGAFKAYVHQRLDEANIPTHPSGPHSTEGCRIGHPLDIALARLKPSGQVAEDVNWLLHEHHHRNEPPDAYTTRVQRLAALAQRTQEAEKDATTLRNESMTLYATLQRLRSSADVAESQLRAIRERAEDPHGMREAGGRAKAEQGDGWTDATVAAAIARWAVDGNPPGTSESSPTDVEPGSTLTERGTRRYPCSPTCTHDDAATPGHAARVAERSKAFSEAASPDAGAVEETDDSREAIERVADEDAYDRGAEAMRAACWEAIGTVLGREGMEPSFLFDELKAAIEGAVL